MYCYIADHRLESEILKRTKGLSKKQFYLKTRRFLQAGLLKKGEGTFLGKNFGIVVFHTQLVIESDIKNCWKLKPVISFRQHVVLIKKILTDNRIENILVKQG